MTLEQVTKVVTRNLNRVIDVNFYPVEEAKRSNFRHRPVGLGVQGLADAFIMVRRKCFFRSFFFSQDCFRSHAGLVIAPMDLKDPPNLCVVFPHQTNRHKAKKTNASNPSRALCPLVEMNLSVDRDDLMCGYIT